MFVRSLLENNNRRVTGPTVMLGDNRALYLSSQQDGASTRTRYYERATLLFKRAVLLLILKPMLVSDENMVADILTKATEKAKFIKMRNFLMGVNHSLADKLENAMHASAGATRRLMQSLLSRI